VSLILTVDNGIAACDEVAHANSLGMQVIVTDHHAPGERLPDAAAVINPHRDGDAYPFKALSGVGVAFKLLCALEGEAGWELLEQYADLLAIGTVADVVPLEDENRLFVRRGVELLQNTMRPGLRALLSSAGLSGKPLNAQSIAFGVGPRINAAGRLEAADYAAMLLSTEDEDEAGELAEKLEEFNNRRRALEKTVEDDVLRRIAQEPGLLNRRILAFSGGGWHPGVVGVVCSRLTARFGKPCLLAAVADGEAKGSGRAWTAFHLLRQSACVPGTFCASEAIRWPLGLRRRRTGFLIFSQP
jgi:single-stranded-DNA-specific exonuclease